MNALDVLSVSSFTVPRYNGGAEVVAHTLNIELVKRGFKVGVLTLADTYEQRIDEYGIIRYEVPVKNLFLPGSQLRPSAPRKLAWHLIDIKNLWFQEYLFGLIRNLRPKVIHSHNVNGFSSVIWGVARKLGIPVMHTAHDYYVLCPKTTLLHADHTVCHNPKVPCRIRSSIIRRESGGVNILVSPSQFLLDVHSRFNAFPCASKVVIRNPIPILNNDSVKRMPNSKSQKIRLLYVGKISPHKGIDRLLKAVAILPKERVDLTVVGDGPLSLELRALYDGLDNISFLGKLSNPKVRSLYQSHDLTVIPSIWYENYPTVALESLQSGIPVAATSIGGIPEIIHSGKNGFLVTNGTVEEWVKLLSQLVEEPTTLETIRTDLHDFTFSDWNKSSVDRYVELINRLMSLEGGEGQ